MTKAVVSTIGHDRPGLISDITAVATNLALNIVDSRMTVLGGEFAVLMSVQGSADTLQQFEQDLHSLCQANDLACIFRLTAERADSVPVRPYTATVVAIDHPGIVHAIAGFFSTRGINIRDLHTDTSPAAHTGTPIFNVTLVAEVPATLKVHELKDAFDAFCADEDLDGRLEAER
jgi:glycine cleavage system transcriptional repressor